MAEQLQPCDGVGRCSWSQIGPAFVEVFVAIDPINDVLESQLGEACAEHLLGEACADDRQLGEGSAHNYDSVDDRTCSRIAHKYVRVNNIPQNGKE